MFTGLVEEIGVISQIQRRPNSYTMAIDASEVLEGVKLGDSICVNGVCLTVTTFNAKSFSVGLAPETQNKSNLGDLEIGDKVNLERSLTPQSRMGGHFVQGHIDATGVIESFRPDQDALWMTIKTPQNLMKYIAPKGFIAIDGASLTVVDVGEHWFNVTLIAYSQEKLVQPSKQVGDRVNLEVDILAKYLERLISASPAANESAITPEFLKLHGLTKEGAR